VLRFTTNSTRVFKLEYKPGPRVKTLEEVFRFEDFPVRGNKAKGIRLSRRAVRAAKFANGGDDSENGNGNGGGSAPPVTGGGTPIVPAAPSKPKPSNGNGGAAGDPTGEGQISFEFKNR